MATFSRIAGAAVARQFPHAAATVSSNLIVPATTTTTTRPLFGERGHLGFQAARYYASNDNLPAKTSSDGVVGIPINFTVASKIEGNESQIVTINLEPGQVLRAESGAMMFMTDGITMETTTGGGMSAGFKRMLTGQNVFISDYRYDGPPGTHGQVALGTDFPSKILRLSVEEYGGKLVCQKGALLCASHTIDIQMEFTKNMTSGFFGGEGFVLQALTGEGDVFVKAGGTLIRRDLDEGEQLRISSGCLVAFTQGVDYDVQMMQGIKNAMFGGEGLFVTTLTGPGTVWLQGQPPQRMIGEIARRVPSGGGLAIPIPMGGGGGGGADGGSSSGTESSSSLEDDRSTTKEVELSLANLVISDSINNQENGADEGVHDKEPRERASLEFQHCGASETNANEETRSKQDIHGRRDATDEAAHETINQGTTVEGGSGLGTLDAIDRHTERVTYSAAGNGTDTSSAGDDSLLLSPDELTPIDIDTFRLPSEDQQTEDNLFLAQFFHNSFGDQVEEFDHPNEVNQSEIDFLLSGTLEDIEVDEIEHGSLDELEYEHIFGDSESDSDLLANLEHDLVKLTLEQMPDSPPINYENNDERDDETDELPWYMYCQPCQLENEVHRPEFPGIPTDDLFHALQGLHAIDEDEPLQDGELPFRPPRHPSGLDEVPFTLQNIDQLPDSPSTLDRSFQAYVVSRRPEAVKAALSFSQSFGTGIYQPLFEGERPNEALCLGHKETIYGLQFSPCGNYMATASQDSTVRIWDVASHRLLQTFTEHSKEAECLRVGWASWSWGDDTLDRKCKHKYLLASGGADGIVKVWSASNAEGKWTCLYTLDHGALYHKSIARDDDEREPPQVYTLQFISHWKGIAVGDGECNNFLMTSSDDFVHLWEIASDDDDNAIESTGSIKLVEVMSIHFTCLDDFGYGVSVKNVTSGGLSLDNKENTSSKRLKTAESEENARIAFGGERNPHNIVFVFDAQYCLANGLLGVALSDGSLRLVNGRGVCVAPVTLPGNNSHLTSFCWDAAGARLASCVATGHLILWDIHIDGPIVKPSCKAVLEGGHIPGRPLYGAAYCGGGEPQDLVLSWGVDGRLCLWDSHSDSNIHAPISTLVAKADYPLYAVDVDTHHRDDGDGNSRRIARIGCGGGGFSDAGILGVPAYLFDVRRGHLPSTKKESNKEVAENT